MVAVSDRAVGWPAPPRRRMGIGQPGRRLGWVAGMPPDSASNPDPSRSMSAALGETSNAMIVDRDVVVPPSDSTITKATRFGPATATRLGRPDTDDWSTNTSKHRDCHDGNQGAPHPPPVLAASSRPTVSR